MESFDEAFEQHLGDVYAFLAYRLGNVPDAEDLTQATFERAFRAWGRFDPQRASARTWLLAISRNLLIDHYRTANAHQTQPLDTDPGIAASDTPGDFGLDPGLSAALAKLADRDREIIALRFGGDLSGAEIAEVAGLSLANVQQILSRSLRRLRDELGESSPGR